MKAKRLRALLVAGLLSLAPAVTLTSCGGGGGGGGGGAPVNEKGMPLSLQGRVVIGQIANQMTCRVSFLSGAKARVELIDNFDADNNMTCEGRYVWEPEEKAQACTALIRDLENVDNYGAPDGSKIVIDFSSYGGKLSAVRMSVQGGKEKIEFTSCRVQ